MTHPPKSEARSLTDKEKLAILREFAEDTKNRIHRLWEDRPATAKTLCELIEADAIRILRETEDK